MNIFRYSYDEFVIKARLLTELYISAERAFSDFIDYVPLENDPKTFSFKLVDLILSMASDIEFGMRLLTFYSVQDEEIIKKIVEKINEKRKDDNKVTMSEGSIERINFRELFETFNELSSFLVGQSVEYSYPVILIKPFYADSNVPCWFNIYNQIKHNKLKNYKNGNLKTALEVLGAFYVLVKLLSAIIEIIDSKEKFEISNLQRISYSFKLGSSAIPIINSKIFYNFDYEVKK